MFLEYFYRKSRSKTGPSNKKYTLCSCDNCNSKIELSGHRKRYQNKLHFCSIECEKQSLISGAKGKQTKTTNMAKYGVENPFGSSIVKQKIKSTLIEKYGGHQMFSDEVKDRIANTNLQKYGYASILSKKEVRDLACAKYGVSNACQLRGHVDWKKAYQKQRKTKKQNNKLNVSKIENTFYNGLIALFGKENVQRHVLVNGWDIDFYVKSIQIHFQFDGIYWHGLNRPIEEITKFITKQDKVIYETYLRDQKQISWFKENNLVLIRITDKNFKKFIKENTKCIDC